MSQSLAILWRQAGESFAAASNPDVILAMGEPEGDTNATRPVRNAGAGRNFRTRVPTNTITATSQFILQESNVDTSVLVSYGSEEIGDKVDAANENAFEADDDVRIRAPIGATGTSLICTLMAIEFDPDSGALSFLGHKSAGATNLNLASTTYFVNPVGGRLISSTLAEAAAELRIQEAFEEWSDMYAEVGTCSRLADVIGRSRVDGVNGNMILTMDGGADGVSYEDATNTDDVLAGEDINFTLTTPTGTESWNLEHITSSLISTSAGRFVTAVHGSAERINVNLTRFWPLSGSMTNGEEATEANVQVPAPFSFTSSDLTVHVDRFAGTTPNPTYRYRKEGANGNQTVSFTAIGIQHDASNTDTVTAGDDLNYQVSSPAGGTNFDTQYVSTIGTVAAAAAAKIEAHVQAVKRASEW